MHLWIIIKHMQILLLYDHWGDPQMVVDACYQFIFTTAFTARVLHNIWNQDRVNSQIFYYLFISFILSLFLFVSLLLKNYFTYNMFVKIVSIYYKQLQQLYIAIDKHWDIFTSDVDVQIMKHYAMLSRRFTTVFSSKL